MKKTGQLLRIRALEEALRSASPVKAGRMAKRLVKLKDDWLNSQ